MSAAGTPSQVCIGCGRDTRAGTRLFADRLAVVDDEVTRFVCGDCNERAIAAFGRRPGERDMIQIAARGAGLGLASRGGGFGPNGAA